MREIRKLNEAYVRIHEAFLCFVLRLLLIEKVSTFLMLLEMLHGPFIHATPLCFRRSHGCQVRRTGRFVPYLT